MNKRHQYYNNIGALGGTNPDLTAEEAYFKENFYANFQTGYGTEYVLDAVHRNANGHVWLDLGSGPTSFFWSMVMPTMSKVAFSDISSGSMEILSHFAASQEIPAGYAEAAQYFGICPTVLNRHRKSFVGCERIDIFRPWVSVLLESIDLITAFGVMSLAENVNELEDAVKTISGNLVSDGRFIGASWILKEEHSLKRGFNNSMFSAELLAKAALKNGLRPLELRSIKPKKCNLYDRIEIFVFQKY